MPAGTLTLILGGVRSGKSDFAERLASQLGGDSVLFIATAESRDAEMQHRIRKHQASRPKSWATLESPTAIAAAFANTSMHQSSLLSVILVDCLTLLVSNHLCAVEAEVDPSLRFENVLKSVREEVESLIDLAARNPIHLILVSGEVGLGIVPENRMAREFRDLLGWANQAIGKSATATYMMVAGVAIPLHAFRVHVDQAAQHLDSLMQSPT